MSDNEKLPPDEIVVRKGRVVKLTQWCDWNGKSCITLKAQRLSVGFYTVFLRDPGNGVTQLQGGKTMTATAKKLMDPKIAEKLAKLFKLRNPTKQKISSLRYRRGDDLKVIFQ